jgi:hypothetical protein
MRQTRPQMEVASRRRFSVSEKAIFQGLFSYTRAGSLIRANLSHAAFEVRRPGCSAGHASFDYVRGADPDVGH